jgi:SPP1 family predicted phage head-tail adaptor
LISRRINPGDYPHWLTFQTKTVPADKDDFGASVDEWTDEFNAWGAFEPAGGREFPMSQKRQAESVARIRMPHNPNVSVRDYPSLYRIVYDGRTWDIKSADTMPVGVPIETHFEVSEVR